MTVTLQADTHREKATTWQRLQLRKKKHILPKQNENTVHQKWGKRDVNEKLRENGKM